MEESVIIIGAGIAGLAMGCYAQMNGYRTRIFEMHHQPGGLCTSWKRKGYTFDGGHRGPQAGRDHVSPGQEAVRDHGPLGLSFHLVRP